ncbi:cell wall metabolism sensor histidine kinase WalK [Cyanobium sp. NS01]|uniref:sensor histidine kinase n=1 Tax=Cyanobium sp. NS01 TaxID=261284 RepID=UPI0018611514|nr:ATP-binding protein [Cyanobium sp. NS01]QNI71717.1 two-component sensor histidine kinase [Cyanobium sp. NS01]
MLMKPRKPRQSLRLRLVVWYSLLAGISMLVSDGYTYLEFRQTLLAQIDRSLEVSAIQARKNLDDEVDALVFDPRRDAPLLASLLNDAGVEIYLISLDGSVKEQFGDSLSSLNTSNLKPGYNTLAKPSGRWRIYTKELLSKEGEPSGWLKVAQSLRPMDATLARVFQRNLLKLPILLGMIALGGLFLANRALQPIAQITRTIQRIRVSGDLAQRIHYKSSADDELARLATLFDGMLDSIQATFEHERRFTADASHELRTPLTAMKGRLQVTLSQLRTVETYEETLKAIGQEVDRLIRLSNDLLLLSRLEQNHIGGPMEPVDLGTLLAESAAQIQPLADLRQLQLTTDLAPALQIQGFPDHLIRLFLNLLDNAVKHTPAAGEVSLQARATEAGVQVILRDTGIGIPPEHLPHLFERFYRVEKSRSRALGGTGLGLAIAQEIVLRHHGQISVASEPGVGTTFTITFPRHGDQPVAKP